MRVVMARQALRWRHEQGWSEKDPSRGGGGVVVRVRPGCPGPHSARRMPQFVDLRPEMVGRRFEPRRCRRDDLRRSTAGHGGQAASAARGAHPRAQRREPQGAARAAPASPCLRAHAWPAPNCTGLPLRPTLLCETPRRSGRARPAAPALPGLPEVSGDGPGDGPHRQREPAQCECPLTPARGTGSVGRVRRVRVPSRGVARRVRALPRVGRDAHSAAAQRRSSRGDRVDQDRWLTGRRGARRGARARGWAPRAALLVYISVSCVCALRCAAPPLHTATVGVSSTCSSPRQGTRAAMRATREWG